MADGRDYDGKELLRLVRDSRSPFADRWDIKLLIVEIEDKFATKVVDIPTVFMGSNNYGFHFKLSSRPDVLARLARGDVNMPDYDGFTIDQQVPEVKFEAATYNLLRCEPSIRASRLLYHRIPVENPLPHTEMPVDIAGRRLLVFERAEGVTLDWHVSLSDAKTHVLTQSATIRAALFNFELPLKFAADWFLDRLFEQKPKTLAVPVAATREFCIALFTSKIHATIRDIGDTIGWESDNNTVGPRAAAAKQTLLSLVPRIMPQEIADKPTLYRLVLDHGDFGIHNMLITTDDYTVTSLFDWETGCIVPAILSDPLMAVEIDLVTDDDAAPAITRVPKNATPEKHEGYMAWATHYINVLYEKAPDYKITIQAGRDARHLWFALRDWRGDNPEEYFGALGTWAETRLRELNANEQTYFE